MQESVIRVPATGTDLFAVSKPGRSAGRQWREQRNRRGAQAERAAELQKTRGAGPRGGRVGLTIRRTRHGRLAGVPDLSARILRARPALPPRVRLGRRWAPATCTRESW